jgi:hypothetical protein
VVVNAGEFSLGLLFATDGAGVVPTALVDVREIQRLQRQRNVTIAYNRERFCSWADRLKTSWTRRDRGFEEACAKPIGRFG